jgi:hypothetical protein
MIREDRNAEHMDKESVLAGQMAAMGQLGYPFLHVIDRARNAGADEKFVQEARALLTQLSGEPGEGAIECMKNAKRDLRSTETFLDRWRNYNNDMGFSKNSIRRSTRCRSARNWQSNYPQDWEGRPRE